MCGQPLISHPAHQMKAWARPASSVPALPKLWLMVRVPASSRSSPLASSRTRTQDDPSLKRTLPHINLVKKGEVTTVFMDTAAPTAESSKEEREMFEADVRAADVVLLGAAFFWAVVPSAHAASRSLQRLSAWPARARSACHRHPRAAAPLARAAAADSW